MTGRRRGHARLRTLTRARVVLAVASTAALLAAAACTPAPRQSGPAPAGAQASGAVEFWHPFTDRENDAMNQVLADFRASHPKIKVTVKGGQDDAKMTQAIGAGNGPDVGLSYSTDIVGKFCSSGAWIDLNPYLKRDSVDLGAFAGPVKQYTEFNGKRCAMPVLADAYGIYYNSDLFAAAGIANPPRTLAELADDAKKITVFKPDGSIKVAGFLPLFNFYENSPAHLAPAVGATWLARDGKSAIGSDPAWKDLLTWQKSLVDWYGYDKLEAFRSSLGDEFSADNAFQKGQVAINIDAEFRLAFLADQAPNVKFGVAPLPTRDGANYGAGYVTGNVIGVSKTAKNPEAAWELVKYLTANTGTIVKLANGLKNVPTTTDALSSPALEAGPEFKTFIQIFTNPRSSTTPPSPVGPAYQEKFQDFLSSYQAGKVADLNAGLKDVDNQINQLIQLGG
ncbi:ABC transporter substrate-binding protein [Planosporangium thailandense]|uniref:ABC transporter substrate-binding protein n=1 Tax=Planosporangium thailandense TaxID=765197 RepID=A0ABX0XZQ8_9ACTN|nr:ABC transporter substrate-binding protein [Planosporangium thailandense]NJC71565.1 ABC transporter substrate-binding protein [Planosporangium thailandense]